jgi:hypothetical protein
MNDIEEFDKMFGAPEQEPQAAVDNDIAKFDAMFGSSRGMVKNGNIDLNKRPVVKNEDATISTVRSIGVNIDGRELLIPTVSDDGKILSDKDAIQYFKKTGKHLGEFDSPESSTEYAKKLHEDQAAKYAPAAEPDLDAFDKLAADKKYQPASYQVADLLTNFPANKAAAIAVARNTPVDQQDAVLDSVYELARKKKTWSDANPVSKAGGALTAGVLDLGEAITSITGIQAATGVEASPEQRKFAERLKRVWESADSIEDPEASFLSPTNALYSVSRMAPSLALAGGFGRGAGAGAKMLGIGKKGIAAAESLGAAAAFAPEMYENTYDDLLVRGAPPNVARNAAIASATVQSLIFSTIPKALIPKGWSSEVVSKQLADGIAKRYIKTAGFKVPGAMVAGSVVDEAVKDFAMHQDPELRKYIYDASNTYLKSLGPSAVLSVPGAIAGGSNKKNIDLKSVKGERLAGESKKVSSDAVKSELNNAEILKAAEEGVAPSREQWKKWGFRGQTSAETRQKELQAKAEEIKKQQPQVEAEVKAPEITSVKNEIVNDLRTGRGAEKLESEGGNSFEKWISEASDELRKNPEFANEAVRRAKETQRELNDIETAAVQIQYRGLHNSYANAANRLAEARKLGNSDAIASAQKESQAIWDKISEVEPVYREAGSRSSAAMNARKIELREDMSIANLSRRTLVANAGKEPTPEQSAKIKELSDTVADLQGKLDKYLETGEAPAKEKKSAIKKSVKRERTKVDFENAWADFKSKISGKPIEDIVKEEAGSLNLEVVESAGRLAKAAAKHGVATVEDFLINAKSALGEEFEKHKETLANAWKEHNVNKRIESINKQLDNKIAKIEEELRTGELTKSKKKEPVSTTGIEGKKERLSELRQQKEDLLNPEDPRIGPKEKSLDKSIVKERVELFGGKIENEKPSKVGQTEAIKTKESELADLRRQKQEIADINKPTKEELADRNYKKMLSRNLEKWEQKNRDAEAGIFTKTEKAERELDDVALGLKSQIEDQKIKFKSLEEDARVKSMGAGEKTAYVAKKVLDTSRAIMTSFDDSALLRQGGWVTLGHPILAGKTVPEAAKAAWSKEHEFKIAEHIKNRPNGKWYKRAKLAITESEGKITAQEEAYMGAARGTNIPVAKQFMGIVAGSERAYVTTLNLMRADLFDVLSKNLTKSGGEMTIKEAKAIANYVNAATGRGNLGKFNEASRFLTTFLFSPRFLWSRFQLLSGQPMWGGTARTRKLIAKEYARTLAGLGTLYGSVWAASKMFGKGDITVEDDARSSNVGKIRIGNTWIDPLAGLSQVISFMSQSASGQKKRSTGELAPIRDKWTLSDRKRGRDDPTWLDVAASFLRSKGSPPAGAVVDILQGKDFKGDDTTVSGLAIRNMLPMPMRDMYENLTETGMLPGTALSLLGFFGMNSSTYESAKPGDFAFKISRHKDISGVSKKTKARFNYGSEIREVVEHANELGISENEMLNGLAEKLKKQGYKQEAISEWKSRLRQRLRAYSASKTENE